MTLLQLPARPIVVAEGDAGLTTSAVAAPSIVPAASVVSTALPTVVPSLSTTVAASSVVSLASTVSAALPPVASALAITVFSRLLFCSDRDRNTNERIHVQRPVHMSDMGQGWLVLPMTPSTFPMYVPSSARTMMAFNAGEEPSKLTEQATLVAFGFHRAREHLKTCAFLRSSPFGVVGFRRSYVAEAAALRRALMRWP